MSRFKAVLFDYDDTLASTYQARVTAAKIGAEGHLAPDLDMERIMKEWAGRPQVDIYSDLSSDRETVARMLDGYTRAYWKMSPEQVKLFPGVLDVLRELKASGFVLALVTSKVRLLRNEDGPYGVEVEMERLGLDGLFDVVVGWEDVKETKPAPGPILFALDRLGMDARDAIMVGDSHIDIKTARGAGTASVGATWGTLAKDLLIAATPDYVIDAPSELRSIVL